MPKGIYEPIGVGSGSGGGGGGSSGRTVLTANATYYVNSATGSDSNPGTALLPFATPQHAINVVASYDYAGLYAPTIIIADGTYVGGWIIPTLVGGPVTGIGFQGDTTTPANCVVDCTSIAPLVFNGSAQLGGFHFKADGALFHLAPAVTVGIFTLNEIQLVSGAAGNATLIEMFGTGSTFTNGGQLTVSGSCVYGDYQTFCESDNGSLATLLDGGTLIWNATALFVTSMFSTFNGGIDVSFGWITGTGSITGAIFQVLQGGVVYGNDYTPATFLNNLTTPQATTGFFDSTSCWNFQFNYNIPGLILSRIDSPSSAGTVSIASWQGLEILTPAGVLTSLTINLPPLVYFGSTPRITIANNSVHSISAITWATTDSTTIRFTPPTSLAAGETITFVFKQDASVPGWYLGGGGVGSGSGSGSLTVNSTAISGGASKLLLYDTGGTLGETGTGATADGSAVYSYNSGTPTKSVIGIYGFGNLYGLCPVCPGPSGVPVIGGFYNGMGIGGKSASTGTPIFGILNSSQSSAGLGNATITVYDNNIIDTLNNTLDDGSGNMSAAGAVKSSSSSGGIGYSTGAGGTVTQATSKSTGVTLNKISGQITMNNAALNAQTEVSFTLTNSTIAATDVVVVCIASGASANSYVVGVAATAAGSCVIQLGNVTLVTNLSEAVIVNFAVIKAVNA